MVYHYPFYQTLPFILSQYKDAFPHILVCGPKPSAEFEIFTVDMGPGGYYSYECIGRAIRVHPGYRGYLYVNDDMVVNWWNFAKLDKEKIWKGAEIAVSVAHVINHRPIRDDWMWWKLESGLQSCERAFEKLSELSGSPSTTTRVNYKNMLATHFLNGGNRTLCLRTWSDFAYIPGRLSRNFEALSSIFYKNKVFLEIALPTSLSLLEDWRHWEDAKGVYLPDVVGFRDFFNIKNVWPSFSGDATFLHPVKFFGNRGYHNRRIFKLRVLPYIEEYTSC